MKKSLKIIFAVLGALLALFLGLVTFILISVSGVNLDESKLVDVERSVTFFDSYGTEMETESCGRPVTDIKKIPDNVKNAFIAIEDKRFYEHRGVDYKGLARAFFNNLKSFSFKEGASTISQQLIKNTHLDNKKTFKRKLAEIKLARQLEKKYDKSEILEKYLNTIYFGDGCYGITDASEYYFGKTPEEIDLNESAILAAIIKAPANYSPVKNPEKCKTRKNVVLKAMFDQGYIGENDYKTNCALGVSCEKQAEKGDFGYTYFAKRKVDDILKNSPYTSTNLKVTTECDAEIQKILENAFSFDGVKSDKSAIVIDKNGKIKAYYSTCKETIRQPGSAIKPVLVYAPAIETDTVYSCTPVSDEKTDFNGYSPSNYNDKYYGFVSVKDSLAKSLNVCAVKLFNYTGVERSKSYAEKAGIDFTYGDNSLCLALGGMQKGVTLNQLCASYGVFLNGGKFRESECIKNIIGATKDIIYKPNEKSTKVFGEDTAAIMNDMLKNTVENGTAKKLSFSGFPLYAKTGTVGNDKGNTDAYVISYSSDYILGIWYGNADNSLMDNSVTGGSAPASAACEIWKKIYDGKNKPQEIPMGNSVKEMKIDKLSYEKERKVILADECAPERYTIKTYFKNDKIPKDRASNFSSPKIEKPKISVKFNQIEIQLCLTDLIDAAIYRSDNLIKIPVYDTKGKDKTLFIDRMVLPNRQYVYSVVPYYTDEKNIVHKGDEIFLDKIKTPAIDVGDWWENEFL